MNRFEQILQEQSRLTAEDLATAIQRQRQSGGSLVTCLLEIGVLSEEQIEEALSIAHEMPAVSGTQLQNIPGEVTQLLTGAKAAEHSVIPFAAGPGRVDLACKRPLSPTQVSELEFVLGRTVHCHIALEARLGEALHRVYHQPQAVRLIQLARHLDSPTPEAHVDPTVAPALAAQAPPVRTDSPYRFRAARRLAPRPDADERTSIKLSDNERESIYGSSGQDRLQLDADDQVALQVLESQLASVARPSSIGQAILAFLAPQLENIVLFRPEADQLRGWLADGQPSEQIARLVLDPTTTSRLRELLPETGFLELTSEEEDLRDLLGAGDSSIGIAAGCVRDRLVCLAVGILRRPVNPSRARALSAGMARSSAAFRAWLTQNRTS